MLALISAQSVTCPSLSIDSSSSHCGRGNTVYGSHKDIYQDVQVLKPLNKSKFPVFLVNSRITKLTYVMKVFPHRNGQAPLSFKNETRFACLRHRHVVRNLYVEKNCEAKLDNVSTNISYTIMEYAAHGDFYTFIKQSPKDIDDMLVRTYFRQLIDGLEYLHNSGVAHLDLKPDNLLLDADCMLKITDFDLAYFSDDTMILSSGTKYYRAPEVSQGRCKAIRAADIFSAGIILFVLKSKGVLPQLEDAVTYGVNLADLLYDNTELFWEAHSIGHRRLNFDRDFKELFSSMTRFDPSERASIEEIKKSKWYNGPCYTHEELKIKLGQILSH